MSESGETVEARRIVSFHYTVHDDAQPSASDPVDTSRTRGEPLSILVGQGNIIPGLEEALLGRRVGDRFEVRVPPEKAYGARRDDFRQRVPKKYFRDAHHLRPGMTTVLDTREGGPRPVVVEKVGSSVIDVDLNHPLAGKTLVFDIEITDVRAASAEELAHGHAHGAGGHHH